MGYSIKNHKLSLDGSAVDYIPSPNTAGKIEPKFLVIHFTAGSSDARGTANYFANKANKVSAHLVIDTDGEVVQCAPFNVKTYHAGRSEWGGYRNLNSHSIGIEVVNPGPLEITHNGYVTWWGKAVPPEAGVIEGPHPNNPRGKVYGWLPFTPAQNEAILTIGSELMHKYGLIECVGHDMIAPLRKVDPGPCMNYRIYDRLNQIGEFSKYEWTISGVTQSLNARSGPGTTYDVICQLALGEQVEIVRREGVWWFVQTSAGDHVWVHSKYLSLA